MTQKKRQLSHFLNFYVFLTVELPDIMGDKTVRVRADLHHIIKIETAKNGGNVKEVMEIRLRSKLKSVLILQYLKILCIIGIEVKLDAKNL